MLGIYSLGSVPDHLLSVPSHQERFLIDELRSSFLNLSDFVVNSDWFNNNSRLKEFVFKHDPRMFLRWDVVVKTMFLVNSYYVPVELAYLLSHRHYLSRWMLALEESFVGCPLLSPYYSSSSANLIHHVYHVARFVDCVGVDVHDVPFVFEFGGGYGSMCRLFYNLGFRGRYVIYDSHAFSALQRYYLKSLGLRVVSNVREFMSCSSSILLISDLSDLFSVSDLQFDKSMFVATWSLCESPVSVRESLLRFISRFERFLIAYQDTCNGVDNVSYFGQFCKSISNIVWHVYTIEHIKGSNYLFGGNR